ncbi:hypothetical protein JJB11_11860 [Ramlibacter ginsenosidimutans]|uniref:Uncharacterized protein n=1 Tax=Ramlibacter ginsenosidimutans TaxID=502333 RepID=A0A934TU26_9BURK|nr:hypothetical protein [Ramlibacter ginsenosidimutans]MBK6006787.1 hypothetical protein [Ramlibacter ginsenosidimutans]
MPAVPALPVVPVPVVLPVVPLALPGVDDVVSVLEPVVPLAPIEVPLPVAEPVPLAPAVVPVLGVVAVLPDVEPVPLAVVLLVVSLGDVEVDGIVLELDELAPVSSCFLLQALSDSAAISASAAHCAIGDLIIRNSLSVGLLVLRELAAAPAACGSL